MKPVEFKHQNIVFAKDQPEYQPLPALRIDSPTGEAYRDCGAVSAIKTILCRY